jgi:hypothetical protein
MTIDSRTVALKHQILAPSDEPTGFHSTFLNSIEPDRLREEEKQHPQNYTGQYPKCNGKLDFRMHAQKKNKRKRLQNANMDPLCYQALNIRLKSAIHNKDCQGRMLLLILQFLAVSDPNNCSTVQS